MDKIIEPINSYKLEIKTSHKKGSIKNVSRLFLFFIFKSKIGNKPIKNAKYNSQ
jgi:hypothetical protein